MPVSGGYDPFSLDITDALKPGQDQELMVCVKDQSNLACNPTGKQMTQKFAQPQGAFYAPTSGIWQAVWLEAVPEQYIEGLSLTPVFDGDQLLFAGKVPQAKPQQRLLVTIWDRAGSVAKVTVLPNQIKAINERIIQSYEKR